MEGTSARLVASDADRRVDFIFHLLIYYPYWCLEKGYARRVGPDDGSAEWKERARGWLRVMRIDAWISFFIYSFIIRIGVWKKVMRVGWGRMTGAPNGRNERAVGCE